MQKTFKNFQNPPPPPTPSAAPELTVSNECLSAEVEAASGGHMERGTALGVLDVGVRSGLDEQLHAEGSVVGEGSIVERGLPLVVKSVQGDL